MIVLAIDTAGTGCFAGLYDSVSGQLLGEAGADIGRGHAEQLMDFLDAALLQSGKALSDVGRIAVTVGPGSFTGIRVGVAAARGLSLALGVPAVGVTTLSVLAADHLDRHPGKPVLVAMDARRGDVYCQRFAADGTASDAPQVLALDDARTLADACEADAIAGSAAPLLKEGAEARPDLFSVKTVARIAALAGADAGRPKPLYLRGPDAKPQAGFAVARV